MKGELTAPAGRLLRAPSVKPHAHALFECFPLDGQAHLSVGQAPTPYHVYGGHGVFVGGTADLAAVRALLAPEQVQAVATDEGRALMGLWVFDFNDASLGAHHELQCSLFVSRAPLPPLRAHKLALLEAMLTRPEVQMLCHGLWNNTPKVVAYNRELLALNARLSDSRVELDRQAFSFAVRDAATGSPLVEGRLRRPQRASLGATLALTMRVGLRPLMAIAKQPWLRVPVLNPIGFGLDRNAAADSLTKVGTSALRWFDASCDRLTISDERYRALDFAQQFFQTLEGFNFVYLCPS
jgi:hypothetical protein